MPYYAHSGSQPDRSDWQLLRDHLESVANLAHERASVFGGADWAYLAGLLHDLGKYSEAFQRRLNGSDQRADHSTAGAKLVIEHVAKAMGEPWGQVAKLLAFVIAGHHAGLANGTDPGHERSTLQQRMSAAFGTDIPELDPVWMSELRLPEGLSRLPIKLHSPPDKYSQFGLAFFTRMLFSCLIDADRIDTENHARRTDGLKPLTSDHPPIPVLQAQVAHYVDELSTNAKASEVNTLRQHILHHARSQAALEPGLFSLTVPTGGGKTLTSLAFGLDHAVRHERRRLIYVIPFTSIIEKLRRTKAGIPQHSNLLQCERCCSTCLQ